MARVTIEDCLPHVNNRFHLVLVAAKRARQLASGHEPRVEWDNDKPTVVALREISAGLTDQTVLDESDLPLASAVMEIERNAPEDAAIDG